MVISVCKILAWFMKYFRILYIFAILGEINGTKVDLKACYMGFSYFLCYNFLQFLELCEGKMAILW